MGNEVAVRSYCYLIFYLKTKLTVSNFILCEESSFHKNLEHGIYLCLKFLSSNFVLNTKHLFKE